MSAQPIDLKPETAATLHPINDDPVDYALALARTQLDMLRARAIPLKGRTVLELGPGIDCAVALVLASCGAEMAVADRFPAPWDPGFHPAFYRDFLARWDGPCRALEAVVERGSYDGVLTLVPEPAEALASLGDASTDLVLSNAVLEHVQDLGAVEREMARVTRPGGVQMHQVDCRHHVDFTRPLDHLLIHQAEFEEERERTGCIHGTQLRLQEIAAAFMRDFWIDEIEPNAFADPAYLDRIRPRLKGRFADFPRQSLRITGGRLWLSRKAPVVPRPWWRRVLARR